MEFLNWFAGQLWGWPMMILIFLCGLIFGVGTGFFQVRRLPYILKMTLGRIFKKDAGVGQGTITPLQAVSAALAGCVGNGNIAGVATAIAIGGPGAVFWMWLMGLFGMMTKFVEVVLAVEYREKTESGAFYGGPMYYIEKGMGKKWKPLALFYGIMMILGALGTAVWVQPHTMATALKSTFGVPPMATVCVAVALTALVCFGGFKRIGKFAEAIMPYFVAAYVLFSLGVVVVNIAEVPRVFVMIFEYAFKPHAAIGGFAGSTMIIAIRRGASRGVFSNEAGLGTASMVHATAITNHPCAQGHYGVVEVFIDTIVMCSMTALVILLAAPDVWHSGLNGVELTIAAFSKLYGSFGAAIVSVSVMLAALTTMIGYYFEYKTSVVYVFGEKNMWIFNILWLIPPFIAVTQDVELVWTVVDISTGIEGVPNMFAMLVLAPVFFRVYRQWMKEEKL